jgi:hypothetical protein
MKISIDGTALKRLQQGLLMSRQELDRSIANNLNSAGDALAEDIAVGLAGELGVPEGAMRGLIYVSRATPTTHRYVINSSAAVGAEPPPFERGARTWRDAARPSDFFKRGELVWMVNPNEDRCDICDDIIEKKLVYTIEEIRAKVGGSDIVPGGYTNVFHLNCRCYPVPARTIGRLPEKFSPEVSRLRDTERRIIEDYQVRLGDVAGIVLKTVVK